MSKGIVISSILALAVIVYAGTTATIVPEGQESTLTGEVAFDPIAEANKFWNEKSKDYFSSNAVDFVTLLEESQGNFKNVAGKYGHYSMGDKGELSFIVKGSGTVTEVKNKLKSGFIQVKLDGADKDVRLQVGPVFKGTAVRDSISLISVNDYQNQVEWANISIAFHKLIEQEILSKLDISGSQGKHVEFTGCFTVAPGGKINITPVALHIE